MASAALSPEGLVDAGKSFALNLEDDASFSDVYKQPSPSVHVRSDADEQIILHFAFQTATTLTGVKLVAAARFEEERPASVKFFINHASFGFDDAESLDPIAACEHVPDDGFVALPRVKFAKTTTLSVFIESNVSDSDHTSLGFIEFFGVAGEGMDVAKIEKTPDT